VTSKFSHLLENDVPGQRNYRWVSANPTSLAEKVIENAHPADCGSDNAFFSLKKKISKDRHT
jgi:hypothetical protein